MLQQPEPEDYVIATGVEHSVRELAEYAFSLVDLDYRDHLVVSEAFLRPSDVETLCGDASKAKRQLGWEAKVGFEELIRMMVEADVERLRSRAITRATT
jgi:GDPmannose 4,6-dehydratase